MRPPSRIAPPAGRARTLPTPAAAAGKKGFGEAAAKPAAPRERKPKKKKLKPPSGPVPPPPPPLPVARSPDAAAAPPVDVVAAAAAEADFNKKLAALAAASERAERDRARAADAARTTVLDGVPDYSKPAPSLGAALRGETAAQEGDAAASPSFTQGAGAAVTAVALVAVFLFTSGGGGGGGGGSSARPRPSPRPLSEAERAEITSQLDAFKATLAAAPTDAPALRGAAAAASALGEPASVAVGYLEKAADAAPRDAELWAELGAARLDAGDAKGAVAAYERARAESPDPAAPPLALAAALAGARVDAGDAAAAVKEVAALRAATKDASRAYDLGLLQGKLLAEWPRHAAEADAIYEELAAAVPDDFRAWLARGALARGTGRAGDAARYFLQARYLAKAENERAAVDAVAGR